MATNHLFPAPTDLILDRLASPLGELVLITDEAGHLRALDFPEFEERTHRLLRRHYNGEVTIRSGRAQRSIRDALDAYFAGRLSSIDAIPCRTGGTPFQRSVWNALRTISAGQTRSYGRLAAELASPAASRAVGLANGANPICIVLPCHRVIGADGSLTGYGGGMERKRWLLSHEGVEPR